jgi:hypothetical protein
MKRFLYIVTPLFVVILIITGFYIAHAGSLTPLALPANTMYTLTDIYNLASGTTGTLGSGVIPATPGSASSTFHTITEIYNALSTQIALLSNAKLASGITAFGFTGTLLGDTNAANVLTSALYPGTFSMTNLTVGNVKSGVTFGVNGAQTGTAVGSSTAVLLGTNQTLCYNSSGSTVSCTGTGQDGELQKGVTSSYTDNGNGTITDNGTGLTWQKCSEGQSGASCATGSATTSTWAAALTYCKNNTASLPGSGWYLPNINQLESLIDFGTTTINTTYFPATVSDYYFSSSTYQIPGFENEFWGVNFADGGDIVNDKYIRPSYVRCVRG